ncbi:hypothetical protein IPJ72_04955 [Candidatus Peregrinibacteria bacterium]|nr:MAG: hypothetical protein IPJ72_04955 [Candidatus Peregrinibacteria bacterium]
MIKTISFITALIVLMVIGFFYREPLLEAYQTHLTPNELVITLNTPATDLSPYSLNANNLTRTANIYEGLVQFDSNLKVVPALALSWGNLDPTTWEFKLRKSVLFHDGTVFNAQSVVRSLEDARRYGGSEIKNLLKGVAKIEIMDDTTIQLITQEPDPLILSKLTKFHIHHGDRVGTGPYTFQGWRKGWELKLRAFDHYWGKAPDFARVRYEVITSKQKRKQLFDEGKTDILVAVPRDQALILPETELKKSYNLEVNFLMFQLNNPLLTRENREAIRQLIDPEKLVEIGNFFVRPASQLVAPGVFGYNPDLPFFTYDESAVKRYLFGDVREKITLDYLSTYRTLSDYLRLQLQEAGFAVKNNPVSPEELLARIQNQESALFVIGWQFEDGDAGSFFDAFIHSKGEFNNGRYSNPEVDALIEASRSEIDREKRLAMLREVSKRVNDDLIAIPLFESTRLYAVQKKLEWEPRLDGLVLAKEVR